MDQPTPSMGFSLQTLSSELEYDLWEGQFAIGHGTDISSCSSFLKVQFKSLLDQVERLLIIFKRN